MNNIFTTRSKLNTKANFFEQCHRFWGNFQEIPEIRVRKNILIPKKPSTSLTSRTPCPSKPTPIQASPFKIRRQSSIQLKKPSPPSQSPQKQPSDRSFISIPSIHFDYSQ